VGSGSGKSKSTEGPRHRLTRSSQQRLALRLSSIQKRVEQGRDGCVREVALVGEGREPETETTHLRQHRHFTAGDSADKKIVLQKDNFVFSSSHIRRESPCQNILQLCESTFDKGVSPFHTIMARSKLLEANKLPSQSASLFAPPTAVDPTLVSLFASSVSNSLQRSSSSLTV
jgi:hypothetical protein